MADHRRRYNSYRNAKRRAEAITFLANISLSGKTESRQNGNTSRGGMQEQSCGENESKEEDIFRTTDSVDINTGPSRNKRFIRQRESRQRSPNTGLAHANSSLLQQETETSVHDTPPSSTTSKLRRTFSGSRTRRVSGGTTPPSSPTKGGDRFFTTRSFSGDGGRHRYQKQISSDPYVSLSNHSSSEDVQHVITVKKLSSLESPTEGAEMDYIRHKSSRMYGSGGRIVLVSNHKVPFSVFSHLRYRRVTQYALPRRDSDARTRVSSVVRPRLLDSQELLSNATLLEGVELGDEGKTVSYSHMLVPTLNTSTQSHRKLTFTEGVLGTPPVIGLAATMSPMPLLNERDTESAMDPISQFTVYDPNKLDDPELISGKHKKLFQFSSYRVSIIDYAKPSALKRDINEKFKLRYPRIELTLSKLRSIKREMKKIMMEECEQDPGVLAHAYVYFEKLVLYEKINKENRKLLAGVCLLLAAKLNDIKGGDLQTLVKEIEDTFRENRKDLFAFEFPVLVALEFALHIPIQEVMPHYVRLMQT